MDISRVYKSVWAMLVIIGLLGLVLPAILCAEEETAPAVESESPYKQGLTIAYRLDSAPMQFRNKTGQADGILIDFWRLWSIKSGIPVKFIGAYNAQAQQMVLDGRADLNAGLFKSSQRAQRFDFSVPITSSSYYVYYPQTLTVQSLDDFESRSLGVTRGSFHEFYLREHYPRLKLKLFDGYKALFKALATGQVQGAVTQPLYIRYFLQQQGEELNKYRRLNKPLYARSYHAAVRKGKQSLLQLVDRTMKKISKQDQRVIIQYWLGKLAVNPPENQADRIALTDQEKHWLQQHPVIDIGVDGNWPPIDFLDSNGQHTGIAHDFLERISAMLGVRFNPVAGPTFSKMLDKVQTGQLKVGMTIVKTPEREKRLWFTEPYFSAYKIIVSRRSSTPYRTTGELAGKTVAMEEGYYSVELIKKKFPDINLQLLPSTLDALKEVSWGRADAYIGNGAVVQWLINEYQIANLDITGEAGLKPSGQRFVVYKDKQWQPLVGILNKALAHISREQRKQMAKKWLSFSSPMEDIVSRMQLTEKQWRWIKAHPDIRLGIDKSWPPVEFIDHKGHYQGLSADFIKRFTQLLEVNLVVDPSLSWDETMRRAKHKQLDLLPALVKTPERDKYLNFTRPYLYFSTVIFVNDHFLHTTTLQDLHGKRVGVEKSYVTQELLQRDHPEINLVFVNNNRDGLEQVAQGKIDAYIGNLTTSSYLITQYGISNVKVGGTTPYVLELRMGVRKDWPELAQILNKYLDAMSEEEIAELRHKWLTVKYNVEVDYSTIRNIVIIAAGLLFASLLWIVYIRQKNAALQRSEEQLNRIINTIPLAIMLTDEEGRILRANPYVNDIIHSPNSIVGRNIADFYEDKKEQNVIVKQLSKTGSIKNYQLRIKDESGNILTGLLSAIIIRLGDKKVKLGVFVDLTERIKMEEELKRAKELSEQANRFKTSFLANMSHEIRTPMNAILGMTHLALQTNLNERQQDYINKIDVSARNLLAIINDILDISKIEAGKIIIEKTTFNLDEVLQHLLDLVSIKATEKDVQIIVDKEPGIPVNLLGDPLRLGQILLNLVQNAIKFTEQGKIVIGINLLTRKQNSIRLGFSVADTGIGIEEEKLNSLFEPFIQADNSISRQYGGTGLGLSISRQLVALMGGELTVDSQPGVGSTFKFSLEFEKQQEVANTEQLVFEPGKSTTAKPVRRLKGKILLVEDNKINQQVARELLESFGLLVALADNGQEAVEQVKNTDFDLIIMDVQMPVMDGLEATRILRRDNRFKSIPVIAMTAHAMDGDKEACLEAGMNDYLSKPIDPEELMKLLSNWLESYDVLELEAENNLQPDINLPEEIPGIDLSWGLKRVGGNKKLFIHLLNDFYQSHHDACKKTRQYLLNNNIEAARRQVHTIQGVAGNIGARQLQAAASTLETTIRTGENDLATCQELSEQFCQQAKIVFDALNKLNRSAEHDAHEHGRSETVPDNRNITSEKKMQLRQLTLELQSLLQSGDSEARKIAQEIRHILNEYSFQDEQPVFKQIETCIQNYDFDAASELLKSVRIN